MLNEDMRTAGEVVADIQLSLSPFPNIGGLELLHGRSQIGDITDRVCCSIFKEFTGRCKVVPCTSSSALQGMSSVQAII